MRDHGLETVKPVQRPSADPKRCGRRKVAPVKYHKSENASEVWSGRRRMPSWFGAQIGAGRDRENLRRHAGLDRGRCLALALIALGGERTYMRRAAFLMRAPASNHLR
jgi:hypothetical protein